MVILCGDVRTCGSRGTVGQLIVKYPLHVNATGGYNRTPGVAERHFQLAYLFCRNKSSVEP